MANEDHNKTVAETLRYSTEQFDKTITFIASGALVVSFAFIKDIIPDLKAAVNKAYLINAWYTYAGVIFLSLVTHFISMLANTWAAKNQNLSDEAFNKGIKYWNFPIRFLNITMIVALLVGSIFLIKFINLNL
ncbi:hypothetical protein GCM10011506_40410 [Marivirga lumbricoides]|uniref:Uncharacterized protein n=1 Tax=Marivirga lumbricoides TaxID=1046115 RepID=A0ABQ1N1N0_9BACT|nr:hypothetical protein GCM10011506_40410 [Marivirga lumbricoides]